MSEKPLMLCRTLDIWQRSGAGRDVNRLGLVFHTSCVNYGTEDLGALRSQFPECLWILPDNVSLELRALRRSPAYCRSAEFLLRNADIVAEWDLEGLYRNCPPQPRLSGYYRRRLLFLFGDLLKQDEFVRMAQPQEGFDILLCDDWSMQKSNPQIDALSVCQKHVSRKTRPLNGLDAGTPLNERPFLWPDESPGRRIPGRHFKRVTKYSPGGYASIYSCDDEFPNLLVKGYKDFSATRARLKKLRILQNLAYTSAGSLPLALPLNLLYSDEEICAGYTMKEYPGKTLRTMLNENDTRLNDYEGALDEIFSSLFLLMLELHSRHILVNDLSLRNVVVSDRNRVGFVDCDSFQVIYYPGGQMHVDYRHRDLREEDAERTLREPMYEYFALAVLMFQCFFGAVSPLTRIVHDDQPQWNWREHEFPLDFNELDGYARNADGVPFEVNSKFYRLWQEKPEKWRQAFSDVFHFRRVLSVGHWFRTLGVSV